MDFILAGTKMGKSGWRESMTMAKEYCEKNGIQMALLKLNK